MSDYFYEPQQQDPAPPPPQMQPPSRSASMAMTALLLGILSMAGFCCLLPPFLLGGTAIALALLSRGRTQRLSAPALAGIGLSCLSIVIVIYLIVSSFMYVAAHPDELREELKTYSEFYEQIYGEDITGPLNQLFPDLQLETE